MRSAFGRKISKFFRNYSFAFLPRMIFLFDLFSKYFLHSPLRMKTAFLRKKRKSFEKNIFPLSDGREMLKQSIGWIIFCIYYPTEEKKAVLAVIFEKISLHSPLDTKTQFGRTFFEKIKIFIPLYLSWKKVNPINVSADGIREIKMTRCIKIKYQKFS